MTATEVPSRDFLDASGCSCLCKSHNMCNVRGGKQRFTHDFTQTICPSHQLRSWQPFDSTPPTIIPRYCTTLSRSSLRQQDGATRKKQLPTSCDTETRNRSALYSPTPENAAHTGSDPWLDVQLRDVVPAPSNEEPCAFERREL